MVYLRTGTVAVAQTSPTLAPTTSPTTTMGDCKNNAPADAFVDYIQCGGQYHIQYGGETCCPQGQVCQIVNNYVSKCIPKTTKTSPTTVAITTFTTTTTTMGDCKNTQVDAWCGGQYYMQHGPGLTCCPQGQDCIYINVRESRCKVNPTPSSITTTTVTTTTKTTATYVEVWRLYGFLLSLEINIMKRWRKEKEKKGYKKRDVESWSIKENLPEGNLAILKLKFIFWACHTSIRIQQK